MFVFVVKILGSVTESTPKSSLVIVQYSRLPFRLLHSGR